MTMPCIALNMCLRDVMTANVMTIPHDAQAEDAARLFLDRGISGAPVVDAEGRGLGVVSKTDLLRCVQTRTEGLKGVVVESIMTPLNFALPESATLSQAAALMAYEGFHRITVVDGDGRITGLVSALDVLRWMARSEGFLVPDVAQTRRVSRA
ncbi:MAG: CBS domain-containing protein [Deltaproteobacteria bacterium]|nr:CBS domain-containing protein [Deltaproteobacteria bacterium]